MADKRGRRPWIKVQLRDTSQARQAAAIVTEWKQQRQATECLTQAVLMYQALQQNSSDRMARLPYQLPAMPSSSISQAAGTQRKRVGQQRPAAYQEKSTKLDDVLDPLGLSELDFS